MAEATIALMWAAARNIALMDREMRAGSWLREDGMQLTGKTLGLIGFGGIGAEVARIAAGSGMTVLAWNRTPKNRAGGSSFVALERLLAESDVVSLHLLLTDETRGFLSPGAHRGDEAGRHAGQHRARRAGGRGGDDRGAARQASCAMPASTCSTPSRCRRNIR